MEVRRARTREKLCHNCDTKPVLTAQADFFDDGRLLILCNLLKPQICPKIPAYRLIRQILLFSATYNRHPTTVTPVYQNHTAAANISMGFLLDRQALKWRSPTLEQIPELTGVGALGPGIGRLDACRCCLDNPHNKLDN